MGASEADCRRWLEPESPQRRTVIRAFYIDRYEVTNAQFERFVSATCHRTMVERGGGGHVRTSKDGKTTFPKVEGATWRAPSGPGTVAQPRLAGNVWEWVEDWFDARYYEKAPEQNPEGPDTRSSKIHRGGAWNNNWIALRVARRVDSVGPGSNVVGFRCAKEAPGGSP